MTVEVIPTGAALGAEISGVDLGRALSPDEFTAVHDAWLAHGVIFFRDQSLADEDLIRFSRRFGELDVSPASEISGRGGSSAPRFPEIWVISNVTEGGVPIGSLGSGEAEWHTDMSYVDHPPKASALYALEIPDGGGDTSFADMSRAYDALPPALRRQIDGLFANHDSTYTSAGELRKGAAPVADVTRAPGARHPIVRRHDETGCDALYLGRRTNGYVRGLSVAESEALLDELWARCTRSEFVYRHRWRVGDLVMWDNRRTIHRREAFDADARRIMHRTQIKASA